MIAAAHGDDAGKVGDARRKVRDRNVTLDERRRFVESIGVKRRTYAVSDEGEVIRIRRQVAAQALEAPAANTIDH
jgi:hypothetical protein